MDNRTVLEDHDQYRILLDPDKDAVLFDWRHVAGLSVEDFRAGIAAFAGQCRTHTPSRALIDARKLDQASPAVAWLRGQLVESGQEEYDAWWMREIVPVYHDAGISGLAVATGDPNAPGELDVRPGVEFKMGYFADLVSAIDWQTA